MVDKTQYGPRQGRFWVTSTNQQWVADATGLPLEEVNQRYKEARAKDIICTIVVGG